MKIVNFLAGKPSIRNIVRLLISLTMQWRNPKRTYFVMWNRVHNCCRRSRCDWPIRLVISVIFRRCRICAEWSSRRILTLERWICCRCPTNLFRIARNGKRFTAKCPYGSGEAAAMDLIYWHKHNSFHASSHPHPTHPFLSLSHFYSSCMCSLSRKRIVSISGSDQFCRRLLSTDLDSWWDRMFRANIFKLFNFKF